MLTTPWLVIVLIWYAVAYSGLINPSLVPRPHEVAARFLALLTQGRLLTDMWMSTQRVFLGVACGILLAVPVGFMLGWYRGIRGFIDPLINVTADFLLKVDPLPIPASCASSSIAKRV